MPPTRSSLGAAVVLALLAPAATAAQRWERVGPAMALPCAIAASPASSRVVWAGLGSGGVFRSADGGKAWRFAGTGIGRGESCVLAADASRPDRAYLLSADGLRRTTDGGRSWTGPQRDFPLPLDGGPRPGGLLSVGGAQGGLYAAVPAGVMWSGDGGRSWVKRSRGLRGRVLELAIDPASPGAFFALTDLGTSHSANGGRTWIAVRPPPTRLAAEAVTATPRGVFLATREEVWRSRDRGARWQKVFTPSDGDGPWELWSDPRSGRLYLGVGANRAERLLASDDEGLSWSPVPSAPGDVRLMSLVDGATYAVARTGIYRSSAGTDEWARTSQGLRAGDVSSLTGDLAVAGAVFAAAGHDGLWHGRPGLGVWRDVRPSVDLPSTVVTSLAATPPILLVGSYDSVFVSSSRGQQWTERPALPCVEIARLRAAPGAVPLLYASGYVYTAGCLDEEPDLCRSALSRDLGATWTCVPFLVAIDPFTQTLYGYPEGLGFARSFDLGVTWQPVIAAVVGAMAFTGTPTVYAGIAGGVGRSDDGGAGWTALPFPAGVSPVALAVDPRDPETVHAATATRGVFSSRDGGRSWTRMGTGLGEVTVNGIFVDRRDGGAVYLATTGGGVMRLSSGPAPPSSPPPPRAAPGGPPGPPA